MGPMAAVVWVIVGVLLVAAEVLSGEFVLLMLGIGALAAAASAALAAPVWVCVLVFAVVSAGLVVGARPLLKRRLHVRDVSPTNVAALVGGQAMVVETVDAQHGRVKLKGEIWTARPLDETQVLEIGRSVTVMDISGATAVVWAQP